MNLNSLKLNLKNDWLSNIRGDVLSAIVVALALIPEAIAFSIIAGVDPKIGLYASFSIAIIISFVGGRPAMISAATGAMALVMVSLVKDHGLQYLFAATILTGIIQIFAGVLRLGALLRFVSRSVMNGFVNALAILIFMAQLPEFVGAGVDLYLMVAFGLAIIYLFPRITKKIPSPLVAIIVLSAISIYFNLGLPTVGDKGELPSELPIFLIPNIPFNFETLKIIFPYSFTLAAVGLLESLMTASIVDDFTETKSNKNRECRGQGIANIITGFLGGMAGCAMIGQSVINVKSGGRTRLSTFLAGVFLLIFILVLSDIVRIIPMAALVSVMIMVSIGTFNWQTITKIRSAPKTSSFVTFVVVCVVVFTHDLAQGVFIGVLLSSIFFARKVSRFFSVRAVKMGEGDQKIYEIHGEVFFASCAKFLDSFNFNEKLTKVTIDLENAHFWDYSAIAALDKAVLRFRKNKIETEVIGLNKASATLVEKYGVHDKNDDAITDFLVH